MKSLWIILGLCLLAKAETTLTINNASLVLNNVSVAISPVSSSAAPNDETCYWKLDEASGSDNRVDSGPNGQDLDPVTTQTSTNAVISLGASWTIGSTDYMTHTDSTTLSCGDIDFTIGAWMMKYDNSARGCINKGGLGSAAVIEYGLYTDGTGWKFVVSNGTTFTTVTSSAVSNNVWYYVVAWHDLTANTINIQVNDGTPVSQAHSVGCQDSTGQFTVGRAADGFQFHGALDEVGFWKRLLTDNEKTYLYNAGAGRTCCPFP